jgi:dihydroorotate dehydrogenase
MIKRFERLKPWLLLPTHLGHSFSPFFLKLYGRFSPSKSYTWKPFTWRGLDFTNPLGVAGGFDKNAELVHELWTLGVGFVEVGTVTPNHQKKNTGKTVDRDVKGKALWNQLGFPSEGCDAVKKRLKSLKHPHFTPVFINIGKNRDTPMERACDDYVKLIRAFGDVADAFVINISSPNTPQLRSLLSPDKLQDFLSVIIEENKDASIGKPTPILLKLSPDMTEGELKKILDVSLEAGIDGWILTNTTLARENGSSFPKTGGVSGLPLKEKSKLLLKCAVAHLGKNKQGKLLVSVGGVMTSQDVFERLQIGADLVQVYSTLVFEGPFFFKKVFQDSLEFYKIPR